MHLSFYTNPTTGGTHYLSLSLCRHIPLKKGRTTLDTAGVIPHFRTPITTGKKGFCVQSVMTRITLLLKPEGQLYHSFKSHLTASSMPKAEEKREEKERQEQRFGIKEDGFHCEFQPRQV